MPNNENINKVGRIVYVEPNNFSSDGKALSSDNQIPHPYEDYAMSVDLIVDIPDRNTCGHPENFRNTSKTGSVTFSSSRGTIGFMQGDNGFLTTKYTDISANNIGNGCNECIGIESLNIRYTSWQYPQVSAKFVDIRGAGLMLPQEKAYYEQLANEADPLHSAAELNGTEIKGGSFFKALFSFPYPKFTLKVKGYYGKEVTYILAIENCKCSFNCETGNFEVAVEFIGYMYGVYSDLPMHFLSVAPYMDYVGRAHWNEQKKNGRFSFIKYEEKEKEEEENGQKVKKKVKEKTPEGEILTFMEFHDLVKSVSKEFDKQFKEDARYKEYQNANKAHRALTALAFPLVVTSSQDVNQWHYVSKPTGNKFYRISTSDDTFVKNYEDIRAKLVTFKEESVKIRENYKINIDNPEDLIKNTTWPEKKLPAIYAKLTMDSGKTSYSVTETKGSISTTIPTLIDEFPAVEALIDKTGKPKTKAVSYDTVTIYSLPAASNYNLKIKEKIREINQKLDELTKVVKEEKTHKMIENLKFTPSIENMFNMVFAHMETFLTAFYACLNAIDSQKTTRTIGNWGLTNRPTDINATDANAPVPPFPLFLKQNEKGETVAAWPAEVLPEAIAENMPEVRLIYSMLNAAKLYEHETLTAESVITQHSIEKKPEISSFIPLTYIDFWKTIEDPDYNAYDTIAKNIDKDDIDKLLILTYAFRVYYYFLGHASVSEEDIEWIGKTEARNLYKALQNKNIYKLLNKFLAIYHEQPGLFVETLQKNTLSSAVNGVVDNATFLVTVDDKVKYDWYKFTGKYHIPIEPYDFKEYSDFYLYTPAGKPKLIYRPDNLSDIVEETGTFKLFTDTNFPQRFSNLYSGHYSIAATMDAASAAVLFDKSFKYSSGHKFETAYPYLISTFIDPNEKDGEGAKYTFSDMISNIGATDETSTIDKYQVRYPGAYAFEKDSVYTIYGDSIFYRQNGHESKVLANKAKAYLFLFSLPIRGNAFAYGKSNIFYNGTYLYSQLLREGAFYWRKKYMEEYGEDPIISDYKTSSISAWMQPEKSSQELDYWFNMADEDSSREHFHMGPNPKEYTNMASASSKTNITSSRIEELIKAFETWSESTEKTGFITINNYLELLDPVTGDNMIGLDKEKLMTDMTTDGKVRLFTAADHYVLNDMELTSYLRFKTDKYRVYEDIDPKNIDTKIKNLRMNTARLDELDNHQKLAQESLVKFMEKTCCVIDYVALNNNGTLTTTELDEKIPVKNIDESFKAFINELWSLSDAENVIKSEDEAATVVKDDFNDDDMRLSLYMTLKNLHDKWFCSNSLDRWKLNVKHDIPNFSDFDCFCYYDNFYHDISDELIVGPSLAAETLSEYCPESKHAGINTVNMSKTVFEYLQLITQKCGAMMLALPISFGMKSAVDIQDMFNTTSFNNRISDDRNSYVVIYTYKSSQSPDNDDPNALKNDGFDIADSLGNIKDTIPAMLTTMDADDAVIPAFGVTYAKQNQSYFKKITLNMDSPTVTEYSIAATTNIASKASSAPRDTTLFGQDLYRVYSNYAYNCGVEMIGCAQIMPLMYFQLNNIPMWKGAYIITKVSHDIAAGTMTTNFEGVRICKNSIPISKGSIPIPDELGSLLNPEDDETKTEYSGTPVTVADRSKNALLISGGRGINRVSDTKEFCSSLVKTIEVKIHNEQGNEDKMKITVNKYLADDVIKIFDLIFDAKVNGEYFRIIQRNNTGCFFYRPIKNPNSPGNKTLSYHSYGAAIDINSGDNPFIKPDGKTDSITRIRTNDHPVVKIFKQFNWTWGGNFKSSSKDYMHFCPLE